MKVGVPTEIKTDEYRVSLTPAGARELVEHGHEVIVQAGAGEGSTIPDDEYVAQGARIAPDAVSVFDEAELIRSLEAFIEQNGQWERAARELYCHRHTLRYRIRRVEQLTGRDLSSARDRIEFWLALRARELVT